MKLNLFTPSQPAFKGRREDRNTVEQLKKNNNYSLTENNQIRINKAIDNLSKESGENNVKFLLDVAEDLKYGTNIDLGKQSKNDWKSKLHNATKQSLAISNPIVQKKYTPLMDKVFNTKKGLTDDEKSIMTSRENILSRLDLSQLENETNPNIKKVKNNLDYFISSSETPIKQKKYVLNRLDYFMSDDYKINPQLEGKKTKVLAEMINDLVVDTHESEVPNIKAINQKSHGMCAAISIARKTMAYEDKPNYVDNLLSELDDTPHVMIYDKTQLGKGQRVPVEKIPVDFDAAEKKGYRIVDASTTQWMNIGDLYDSSNKPKEYYVSFDTENFGAEYDNHFLMPMEDPNLASKHKYYQSLLVSKEAIGNAKKMQLGKDISTNDRHQNHDKNIEYLQKVHTQLKSDIKAVLPNSNEKEIHNTFSKLLSLRKDVASDINKIKDGTAQYHFIPNEESKMKDKKVRAFLLNSNKNINSEALDAKTTNIRELIETSHSIQKDLHSSSSQAGKISNARKLYTAAAAYRNHVNVSLNDNDYLTDKMIKYNVDDKDTLLSQNISKVIKHIEKTGDENYINHFSNILGIDADKKTVVDNLSELKKGLDTIYTTTLDEGYRLLGLGDRKQSMYFEVKGLRESIEQGDKESLSDASFALGLAKPDKNKVLKEYSKFEKTLLNGASDKEYTEIYNKMGYKNQLQSFADAFNIVKHAMQNPEDGDSPTIIQAFNEANKLPEETPLDTSKQYLMSIGASFNNLSENVSYVRSIMLVADGEGRIINSPLPEDAVMKKMEDKGEVVSEKELIPLRDRFDKIDKLRSEDEFSSRQGKISDPSLYKLSNGEKETLKRISKSINQMYSDVNKEEAFVLGEIRKPLEEHSRKMGVGMGSYWVPQITGGMNTEKEVKIIQQMTDRKYQSTKDLEKAVDKIKNSPHSGVTGSSVFHDKMGAHAQYVAEISPLNGKDVLYHDNSWGACEQENTWVDSDGVKRTDYSDHRGGETGYITNDKYRNGNYVDDLMYKGCEVVSDAPTSKELKKLTRDNDGYKFSSVFDVILPGDDGTVKRVAAGLKDTIFIPTRDYIEDLNKLASNMTQAEIRQEIAKNKKAGSAYLKDYEKIEKRIETTPFNKGIDTEDDYNSLANNDIVKVNFEKVALTRSFPDGADWKELAKANTVEEVKAFEKQRDENARSYFDYAFGKEPKVLYSYALNKDKNKVFSILSDALKHNNIKLSNKEKISIIKNTAMYEGDEINQFDGSLKHTIGFMVNKTLKQFDKVVPDSESAQKAKEEIKEKLTQSLSDSLYFNEEDVNNTSTKFKAIAGYIDRKYNPETDADFVKEYRRFQDMTTEEFKNETSDVQHKDLGIKDYTGYEMLRRFKASDEKTESTLRNVMFQKELLKDVKLSETKPSYKYHKLYKHQQGATYINADPKTGKGGRTFDDLYRDFSMSMTSLSYDKMFNKSKAEALRKYNVFPAYPKIKLISDVDAENVENTINDLLMKTLTNVNSKKATLRVYDIHTQLADEINSIPDNSKLSKKQAAKINNLAGEFVTRSYNDTDVQKSVQSALEVLELKKGATGTDYKKAFAGMDKEITNYKLISPETVIKKSIDNDITSLNKGFDALMASVVPEKQKNLREDLNNFTTEVLKSDNSRYDSNDKMKQLSQKIDKYSLNKKNFAITKSEYLTSIEYDINQMKQTKIASDDNKMYKEQAIQQFTEHFNESLLFVSEDKQEDFIKTVNELTNTDKKLTSKKVNEKVNEYTGNNNTKLTKQLVKSIIVLNNSINLEKEYSQSLNKALNDVNSKTQKFLDGNIKPEYHKSVALSVGDYIKTSVSPKNRYNADKVQIANDKLLDDYRKYHIINTPDKLLENYLLLSAKDSPTHSRNKDISTNAKLALKTSESLLNSAVIVSDLIEVQESLMEAVSTGNASAVADKFRNYDVPIVDSKTNAPLTMAAPQSIDYIVKGLMLNTNDDTAVMFIDKLGLADKFIQVENDLFDINDVKADVDDVVNILETANDLTLKMDEAVAPIKSPDFNNDDNYAETIDNVKKDFIEKTKDSKAPEGVKLFLESLDNLKKIISANPNLPKNRLAIEYIGNVSNTIANEANDSVQSIQSGLTIFDKMHKLINKLDIPEYSPAYQEREKFNHKFDEYEQYNNERFLNIANISSPYLDITVNEV